jgi:hypothetical protein
MNPPIAAITGRATLLFTAGALIGCSASAPPPSPREGGEGGEIAATPEPRTKAPKPEPYLFRDAGLEARFFSTPDVEKREGMVADGLFLVATRVVASDDHHAHVLTRMELKGAGKYDCDSAIDGMVERTLAELGCLPIQNVGMTLSSIPARDVTFQCEPIPMRGAMRVICDTRALEDGKVSAYSLLSAYDSKRWSPAETKAFFDGVKLPQ